MNRKAAGRSGRFADRIRRRSLLTCVLPAAAAAAIAMSATPALASAAADPGAPVTPPCAWGIEVTANTLNVLLPDSSAAYWVLPFTVQDGLRITLSGQFPDSRYASLDVYGAKGGLFTDDGVGSGLTDYRIQPDPGSVNPWQQAGRAGGGYAVTLTSNVTPGQANTLPLAPTGTTSGAGYLVYRVYLPSSGQFSTVPLPSVSFTRDGVTTTVPRCPDTATSPGILPAGVTQGRGADTAPTASGTVPFARTGGSGNLFPNADQAYLSARVVPPANGNVLVIRGQAPTTPSQPVPSPWPSAGTDLRYWSLCVSLDSPLRPTVVNHLPGGGVDDGCRHDTQVSLNAGGDYTFVVGTEAQRAAIQAVPGVTFLPFSTAHPDAVSTLTLRNMVAAPGFAQAIQNVTTENSPAAAESVMGAYYPRAAFCPLTTLATNGPGACLPGLRSPPTGV